jgi:hypothetical protein
MARLAAARGMVAVATEALDNCLIQFAFPDGDKSGDERKEALEALVDAAGDLSRSVENAQAGLEKLSGKELSEEEPDEEEDLDEGDDED